MKPVKCHVKILHVSMSQFEYVSIKQALL